MLNGFRAVYFSSPKKKVSNESLLNTLFYWGFLGMASRQLPIQLFYQWAGLNVTTADNIVVVDTTSDDLDSW